MIAASRYAKSLIDLAIETNQLEEIRNDMRLIKDVCAGNRDFVLLLQSPIVKTDKKIAIFSSVFEGKISKTSLSFLHIIATKRREGYIDAIASSFDDQYKVYKNITTVLVQSAVALDEKLRKEILSVVKTATTGEIEIIEKTDPSLIGGFILTINDKRVDQSVKRKLNDLKKDFSRNEFVPNLN